MGEDQASISEPGGAATRRGLLVGAGAIGAGVVLAGCGGDQGDAGDGRSGAGATGNGAVELAKTSDIPIGGGMIFAKQGVVVTQPTQGVFKGFSSVCTHQGCPVARIDGGTINCTCHDSRFSIEDGSVRGGPATKPLPAKEIKVDGETITLS
ncbi:MAG TPA: Rieske (2Fe-2S) protein [Micromonosporaceae bacterium]|nr:Rieske (2Fe-2S) protein [Micromonosporaceae bacterium]